MMWIMAACPLLLLVAVGGCLLNMNREGDSIGLGD